MKLQINVPVSGLDLASLLQGEEGFFLCQNRGQNFIAVAKAGHSIAFGRTPIGRGIIEQPSATLGPEPWVVTKISNSTEFAEFGETVPGNGKASRKKTKQEGENCKDWMGNHRGLFFADHREARSSA